MLIRVAKAAPLIYLSVRQFSPNYVLYFPKITTKNTDAKKGFL